MLLSPQKGSELSAEPTIVHVIENGQSPFAVEIIAGSHRWVGDEPKEAGGGGIGPSPYDLLAAALGECTAMTVRFYARRQGWPLDRVEVDIEHKKQPAAGATTMVDHFTKRIRLFGDTLTGEQRDRLLDVAGRCPVQRTLESRPEIETA